MKRMGLLLEHARKSTENEGSGIDDSEFLQYFNDGQDRIQSQIFQTHPESDVFGRVGFLDLLSSEDTYSLETFKDESSATFSSRIFAQNSISLVERANSSASQVRTNVGSGDVSFNVTGAGSGGSPYVFQVTSPTWSALRFSIGSVITLGSYSSESLTVTVIDDANRRLSVTGTSTLLAADTGSTGLAEDVFKIITSVGSASSYYPLKFISNSERRVGYGYMLRNKNLIIAPFPGSSINLGLRVTYFRKVDDLDIRRGTISAVSSGASITITGHSATEALNDDWVSIVDIDGNVIQSEIRMGGFVNGSGVITTSTILNTDVVVNFASYYVVLGKYSTSHSELPDTCERYLLAYVEYQIAMRDSAIDVAVLERHLMKMEADIVELFATNQGDSMHIPITSTEYLIW